MLILVRLSVLLLFCTGGYLVGVRYNDGIIGAAAGLFFGFIATAADQILKKVNMGTVVGGIIGTALGLLFANLILSPLQALLKEDQAAVFFAFRGIFAYGGMLIGLNRGKGITIPGLFRLLSGKGSEENVKVLDTSVIIDGRIADVCEAGFIEGTFVVPQFILQELQYIADSQDPMKRARGRRGLDVLHKIQKMSNITVRIVEEDFPKIREVDSKLVALGKLMNAKIITNDFNLNKVAQLQGVSVLNINELANALKPVVLPGETMRVFVLKEGKEYNQGVAYLDDGTMVVVENGRKSMGKTIDVTVTSVLQTTAGRMIFSKVQEFEKEEVRAAR